MELELQFDGGSRGNPGPSAIGVVLIDRASDRQVLEHGEFLGNATNNQAEYTALRMGLEKMLSWVNEEGEDPASVELRIETDSQLLQKQMDNQWQTNDTSLAAIQDEIRDRLEEVGSWTIHHVPREQNRQADMIVNETLDRQEKNGSGSSGKNGGDGGSSSPEAPRTSFYLIVHGTGGNGNSAGTISYRILDEDRRDLFLESRESEVTDSNLAVYRAVQEGLRMLERILEGSSEEQEDAEASSRDANVSPSESEVIITGINDVVINQISGEYECKDASLSAAKENVEELLEAFHGVRTERADADMMEGLK